MRGLWGAWCWATIAISYVVAVNALSDENDSHLGGLFAAPWTVVRQAPLSLGSSRQEYWRGLPHLPPGGLPDPAMEPISLRSPAMAGRFFPSRATWEDGIIQIPYSGWLKQKTSISNHSVLSPSFSHTGLLALLGRKKKVTMSLSGSPAPMPLCDSSPALFGFLLQCHLRREVFPETLPERQQLCLL